QNRAVLVANSIQFVTYSDVTDTTRSWEVAPIIENVGNTPTRNLRYTTRVGFCPQNPMGDRYDTGINWRSPPKADLVRNAIGPKSEIIGAYQRFGNVTLNCAWSVGFAGLVKFDDIWGHAHLFEFCGATTPHTIDFQHFPAGQRIRIAGFACPK